MSNKKSILLIFTHKAFDTEKIRREEEAFWKKKNKSLQKGVK